ncbi:hypothetical protein N7499_008819 [Penicillium canescens]|nr:hypothetical protein N7499_008819 [Penicillium canescens]
MTTPVRPPRQDVPPAPLSLSGTPVLPDLSARSTASDVAHLHSSDDFELWTRAYEMLQVREPELIEDYKKHLASLRHEGSTDGGISTSRSVEAIVKQLLNDRETKQWRVSLLGKNVKIREQTERLAKFLLWSDPIIKNAVSAQPYAALAWSGVSLLLPVSKRLSDYKRVLTLAATHDRHHKTRGLVERF